MSAVPIKIAMGRTAIHVFTPYDPVINEQIKKVRCYSWNQEKRRWEFPFDPQAIEELIDKLKAWPLTIEEKVSDWYAKAIGITHRVLATLDNPEPTLLVTKSGDLWKFQRVGVNWASTAGRGIIADDMGLGKTIQAIKTIEELEKRGRIRGDGPYLIIAPNSKLEDWAEEIEKWYGDRLPITIVKKPRFEKLLEQPNPTGWFITNWERIPVREHLWLPHKWDVVIGDESHRMKNRDSKRTKAMFKLGKQAKHRYLLTGTPIVNDIPDLWAQLHFVNPTRFSSYWKFVGRYVEIEDDIWGHKILGEQRPDTKEELTSVLKTNMIARQTTDPDVDVQLPPIRHQKIVVELTPRQRKVYNEMLDQYVAWLTDQPTNDEGDVIAPSPMTQVMRLKQIAGSLGIFGMEGINDSAKIDRLIELVQDAPQEKFVILSQYNTIVNEVCKRLQAEGIPHGRMDGGGHQDSWREGESPEGTRHESRHELIKAFQRDPIEDVNAGQSMLRCFVATMQTGGEGITLHAARYLIFLDLMWSPKDTMQSFKRIHRIGQEHSCIIYYLLARNTVDFSAVLPTIRKKTQIIDAVMKPQKPEDFEVG